MSFIAGFEKVAVSEKYVKQKIFGGLVTRSKLPLGDKKTKNLQFWIHQHIQSELKQKKLRGRATKTWIPQGSNVKETFKRFSDLKGNPPANKNMIDLMLGHPLSHTQAEVLAAQPAKKTPLNRAKDLVSELSQIKDEAHAPNKSHLQKHWGKYLAGGAGVGGAGLLLKKRRSPKEDHARA